MKILKGKVKASAADLQGGLRIVVEAEGDEQMTAKSITLGASSAPTR
jgi:hypothetical protein